MNEACKAWRVWEGPPTDRAMAGITSCRRSISTSSEGNRSQLAEKLAHRHTCRGSSPNLG